MNFFSVLRTIICLAFVGFFMLCSAVLFPIEYFLRKKDEKKLCASVFPLQTGDSDGLPF